MITALTLSAFVLAAPPPAGHVWEVDLRPGAFRVQCEKLPHVDLSRGDVMYFTVAFHTPDNVQFVIVYGAQRPRPPVGQAMLFNPSSEAVKVSEVRKIDDANDRSARVIASSAEGFTFTLKENTRVYFSAQSESWEKVDKYEAKGIRLLPEWSPWRYSQEKRVRPLPQQVHWLLDREVYQLQIECFTGAFDYQDWLISVDYLE